MASFRIARMSFARETSRVRRPRARLCYEVLCDWDGSRRYHRVPGSGILVDAETPQQIEWMWDWVTWYMQQLDGNGNRRIPAWRKSAMGMGVARDIAGRIAERPDKRFSVYVYTDMSVGASRLEEVKLVEIACS